MEANASEKKFSFLFYYRNPKALGSRPFVTNIHKTRDGFSSNFLTWKLTEWGYRLNRFFLNIPYYEKDFLEKNNELGSEEYSFDRNELVIHPTRPPLDDWKTELSTDYWKMSPEDIEKAIKRTLEPSFSSLEKCIFDAFRQVFDCCSRAEISLCMDMYPDDDEAYKFSYIKFFQFSGGKILSFVGYGKPEEENLAVGYLVSIPKVDEYGFRLIGSFSSGGAESLWHNALLTEKYPDLLKQAINSESVKLWMIPFHLPDYAPYVFPCRLDELQVNM